MNTHPDTAAWSIDAHRGLVESLVAVVDDVEAPVQECRGLVLARDVTAALPLPPFTNSAMDGFALASADVADVEAPVTLSVTGDIAAGDGTDHRLEPGCAMRIMTGARMPQGADTVVKVEWTDHPAGVADPPSHVRLDRFPDPGANVRHEGEVCAVGDTVLRAGQVLDAAAVSAAVAAGCTRVRVRPHPRVLIVTTGSELVEPGEKVRPGMIPDSNGPLLRGLVEEAGGLVIGHLRCPDDPLLLSSLLAAHDRADLVITAGGISQGAYEVVRRALADSVRFHHVAQQPGGPQGAGTVDVGGQATPVVCLPGNPVSVLVSFAVYVRGLIDILAGRTTGDGASRPPALPGVARVPWRTPAGRTQFIPVRVVRFDEDGRLLVEPSHRLGSGSHAVVGLARADGLAMVDADIDEVDAGMALPIIPLERLRRRRHTVEY